MVPSAEGLLGAFTRTVDYNYIKLGVQESLRPPETLARPSERRQCGGLHVLTRASSS